MITQLLPIMDQTELVKRSMAGEVIGDGKAQIEALVAELRKRPKAIVIDMQDEHHDDVFGVPPNAALIEPAKPVAIMIESEHTRWRFEQAITTETPTKECDVEYVSHMNDANATIVIRQIRDK